MALGFVFISAFPILGRLWSSSTPSLRGGGTEQETVSCRIKRSRSFLVTSVVIVGSTLLFLGLYKSYSRGAWLSAFLGVFYLVMARRRTGATQNERRQATSVLFPGRISGRWAGSAMISRHGSNIILITVSILVISFWCFRETNIRGIRRVFSVANQYDSSWRNRVDAYVGSLQIMADHPWRGVDWSQPEPIYSEYYMSNRLTEGQAIVLNDYFTLAMSLGLPALCCFVGYVLVTLNGERNRASFVGFSSRQIVGSDS
jgi:O-antigen ligase